MFLSVEFLHPFVTPSRVFLVFIGKSSGFQPNTPVATRWFTVDRRQKDVKLAETGRLG